jgi:hypothetical protein
MGGLRVDAAIDREVVRVLAPGAIEAALVSAARAEDHTATTRRAVELELREARYEAERAQRQYDAVEPEHRLVAETLERRWNAALERVRGLEERLAIAQAEPRLVLDRAILLRLAEDFPHVWSASTTDIRTKKRIVRLLIEEIVVTAITGSRPQVGLVIHWKGGTHTQVVIARNRTGQHGRSTDRGVVDVVQALARSLPDAHIARVLNRLGYRTGADNTWTQARVASLRQHHEIPVFDRAVDRRALLTIAEAATALGVSAGTVRRMLIAKILPGTQPVALAPWAIQAADLTLERVQRAVAAVHHGRSLPRSTSEAQLTLDKSHT